MKPMTKARVSTVGAAVTEALGQAHVIMGVLLLQDRGECETYD